MGVHCPSLRAPYPTVRPIPQYHGTGGTIHGSPLSLLKGPISHCPSYPTVPWDRWDCPWESTVPSKGHHIPLSVLSHCTMGQVGLSMGVHCPSLRAPYPTVRPIPQYHGTTSNYNYNALSVNCEQDWKVSATVQFLLSPYKSRDNDGAPYSEEQHYSYLETLRERFRDPYLTVY